MCRSVWVGFRYTDVLRWFPSLLTGKAIGFHSPLQWWIGIDEFVRLDVGGTSLVQYCRVARWRRCRQHIWSMCSVWWWWCSGPSPPGLFATTGERERRTHFCSLSLLKAGRRRPWTPWPSNRAHGSAMRSNLEYAIVTSAIVQHLSHFLLAK